MHPPENNYLAGVLLVPSGLDMVLGFGWGSLHWFVSSSYSPSVALDRLAHLPLLLLPGLNVTILTGVVDCFFCRPMRCFSWKLLNDLNGSSVCGSACSSPFCVPGF